MRGEAGTIVGVRRDKKVKVTRKDVTRTDCVVEGRTFHVVYACLAFLVATVAGFRVSVVF